MTHRLVYKLTPFIPLLKEKNSPANCENYKTIELVVHTNKVLLTIINKIILKAYIIQQILKEQAGFMLGRRTKLYDNCDRNIKIKKETQD